MQPTAPPPEPVRRPATNSATASDAQTTAGATRSALLRRRTRACRCGARCELFTHGADAARILEMMLERYRTLMQVRGEPLVEFSHWSDGMRNTADMLEVTGRLHVALHNLYGVSLTSCPACGGAIDRDDDQDVIDAEVVHEYAELVSASYSYWIGKEIELAQEYSKPIVGVRPWGAQRTPAAVVSAADEIVNWQASSNASAIRRHSL